MNAAFQRPIVRVLAKRLRTAVLAGLLGVSSMSFAITSEDLFARLGHKENILIVDVRSAIAYEAGHIPGAINIPLSLLPHKTLPTSQLIVVYGDGLCEIADTDALALIQANPRVNAEVLAGGYVAWLEQTRVSTQASGIGRERLPGITYQQLLVAPKEDIVLVDLRVPAAPTPPVAMSASKNGRPAIAEAKAPDLLAGFAQKLGLPVVRASSVTAASAARTAEPSDPSHYAATAATSVGSQVQPADGAGKLLVLIADSDAAANDAARHLRAAGYYRFTILIGGTEIIRFEGRQGTGRQGGDSTPVAGPN